MMSYRTAIFRRFLQSRRCFNSAAYDGDGKTTVRVLNHEDPHLNIINSYSARGFRLSNNLFINGSILVFPTHVYSWNVRRGIEINMDSLIVLDLIVPKVKIVIIGYGQQGEPYDASIVAKLKQKNISCELLPTPNAITTYNFLVSDSTHVAGAFVPVKDHVKMERKDVIALKAHDYMTKDEDYLPLAGYERDSMMYYADLKSKINKDKDKKTFDE